jgi:serine/threonine-protein kinase
LVGGTYRIIRHIGSGGSSHVFEAEHVRLGKPFALKLLRPELDPNRQTAQRFRREARAIARLRSEFIVDVVDCGELEDQTPYLVMDLLEGEDLRRLLERSGSLSARRAVPIIMEACRALAEVHGAGLVHRDLKPENLFITRRSSGEDWCKVLDFGVAKMDASLTTNQGALVGTIRYMAPEQLAEGAQVSPATDIYALGAILYECLSGRPVHGGDSIQQAMFNVLNTLPLPLADVPPALDALLARVLSKNPLERPQDALELEASLRGIVIPSRATPTLTTIDESTLLPARPSKRRWGLPLTAVLAAALGALGGAGLVPWCSRSSPRASVGRAPSDGGQSPARRPEVAPLVTASATASVALPAGSASAVASGSGKSRAPLRAGRVAAVHSGAAVSDARPVTVGSLDPSNPYSE